MGLRQPPERIPQRTGSGHLGRAHGEFEPAGQPALPRPAHQILGPVQHLEVREAPGPPVGRSSRQSAPGSNRNELPSGWTSSIPEGSDRRGGPASGVSIALTLM
ncbi:hypothetical protein SMICM17S_02372 [Streptomyces microflavus]